MRKILDGRQGVDGGVKTFEAFRRAPKGGLHAGTQAGRIHVQDEPRPYLRVYHRRRRRILQAVCGKRGVCKRRRRTSGSKTRMVLDGASQDQGKDRPGLKEMNGEVRLVFLPPGCPDLNYRRDLAPDEARRATPDVSRMYGKKGRQSLLSQIPLKKPNGDMILQNCVRRIAYASQRR